VIAEGVIREYNFDGLVGPSHNFGAAVLGNLASASNAGKPSNPRQAALQGIAKMRLLHGLGVPQAVIPPHMRPELDLARRLGFRGPDRAILEQVARQAPPLLAACYAASSMWTANAATVSPSSDSDDGRVHITPANLQSKVHRAIEWPTTQRILRAIFPGEAFVHHETLPGSAGLGDEGAANHNRLAPSHDAPGIQLFVYGESIVDPSIRPRHFPARQTLEASSAIARLHRVPERRTVFAQQHPEAIDAGVFHNDVIAVADRDLLLCHEDAFVDTRATLALLQARFLEETGRELHVVLVTRKELSLERAVSSYLFNSQLVQCGDGRRAWILPQECAEDPEVAALIQRIVDEHPTIATIRYCSLWESMRGGGGPACLRLRAVLAEHEQADLAPGVLFDAELDRALCAWVEQYYRDRLELRDLADPQLLDECRRALDALTQLLGLPLIYTFQT